MISLKRPKNLAQPPKVKVRIKPIRLNKGPRSRKSRKKLGKKRKKRDIKENKTDEKNKTVASSQWGLMSLRLQKVQGRSNIMVKALRKISLRSLAITVIRRITTPGIIPSQKTSCSFNKLYVGDY